MKTSSKFFVMFFIATVLTLFTIAPYLGDALTVFATAALIGGFYYSGKEKGVEESLKLKVTDMASADLICANCGDAPKLYEKDGKWLCRKCAGI
jgi:hypothetical protein